MAILNFDGHTLVEIEFLDPENILLDTFHYFLCQLQIKISKFNKFWPSFLILAAILFLSVGQLSHPSKMHTSDLNNDPGWLAKL